MAESPEILVRWCAAWWLDQTAKDGPMKTHKNLFAKIASFQNLLSAASYRDRVLHHAIHGILEPIFDPTFVHDSYATRKGKGTHAAIDQCQKFTRQCKYVLKCDIRQYFPSIDRGILLKLVSCKIACSDTLWLIQKILDSHQMPGNQIAASQPASQPEVFPSAT